MEVVERQRREVVPSSVLGVLIAVGAEIMLFMGFISAFTIARAGTPPGKWRMPSPTLPAAATGLNTAALVASGVLVYVAYRQIQHRSDAARRTLLAAWCLGAVFVVLQGREWFGLLANGLTLQSSTLGSFFYVIVGAHAVHAVAALIGLGVAWWSLQRGRLSEPFFLGVATFWYFVVAIWPIIYWRVYF
jgi:cytochrome c oxidase subunit 3